MHSFNTKFGSKQVERASEKAFDDVVVQASKLDGQLGSIFCQLKRDNRGRFLLRGMYLPPKWAAKVGRVLKAYEAEQKQEEGRRSILRRRK